MRATWIAMMSLFTIVLIAGGALAHESYDIGDGEYTLTVGDQNEPMYTFKWTNLDLIIRDSDGESVALTEDELDGLNARLLGPGGEVLDRPLETQFGSEGRYEFDQGHYYTQPGQYTLALDGEIQGVDATGQYDLPGPRQSTSGFGFPHEDVPTVIDLQASLEDLEQAQQDNEELEQRVTELENQLETLQEEEQDGTNDAPGASILLAAGALASAAFLARRD